MKSEKSIARSIGVLFLLVLVTWFTGYALIESVIAKPDFLNTIIGSKNTVQLGVLFELLQAAGVVSIAIMLFPIIKGYNERLAIGYLGFRIVESFMLVVIALSALLLISLSREYTSAIDPDTDYFKTLSALLYSLRGEWSQMILALFFSFSGIILHYTFYKTKLIPRFIALWGLVAALLVLINQLMFILFEENLGVYLGIPMLLNELFLGIWLLARGFNTPEENTTKK